MAFSRHESVKEQGMTSSDLINVRKIVLSVEEISHDGGPELDEPILKGAIGAVLANPYAGEYVEDIQPMMDALKPLGLEMSERLVSALGGEPDLIESYGKAAVVGVSGELEHCALWHVPGGYGMRGVLGEAKSLVPSAVKMGAAGVRIDIPLHHKNACYVRSHFDAIEAGVPDGPKPDEIVFWLAMTTGGRPHARMGGLQKEDIIGEDGLR
jgi:hypothetical protein